jgi:hypothetical protein
MVAQAIRDFQVHLANYLRLYNINLDLHPIDQVARLPKEVIFRLSHESVAADMPASASAFEKCADLGEPTTISGRALRACVVARRNELTKLTAYAFTQTFVTEYLSEAYEDIRPLALKVLLFTDTFAEESKELSNALHLAWGLWLLDPRNSFAPDNANSKLYSDLDPISIWAYWSRHLTTPFRIASGANGTQTQWLASGFVYDLRSMMGFVSPTCDVGQVTRELLKEASILRIGSIPPGAFVEINFPPFVMLAFEEINPMFVMVEALDAQDRSLPVHLFPTLARWSVPNTGCGPLNDMESFKQVVEVLAAMSAAALRDFWVVEDRERTLGLPRIARIPRSKKQDRRIVYLPRIRYVGGRDLMAQVERTIDITARAAHWRSDHYRKLPEGQHPTKKQVALAKAYNKQPPDGFTWVRATSVAGIDVERIYRSRSVSSVLFDVMPSKGKVLEDLNWFEFEAHCGQWLREEGFEEIARASVDNGVDITAFSTVAGEPVQWIIQCKHWTYKVGPSVVRELEGARRLRRADRAILIASSAFTPAAIQTARDLGIDLVDGDRLTRSKH